MKDRFVETLDMGSFKIVLKMKSS